MMAALCWKSILEASRQQARGAAMKESPRRERRDAAGKRECVGRGGRRRGYVDAPLAPAMRVEEVRARYAEARWKRGAAAADTPSKQRRPVGAMFTWRHMADAKIFVRTICPTVRSPTAHHHVNCHHPRRFTRRRLHRCPFACGSCCVRTVVEAPVRDAARCSAQPR